MIEKKEKILKFMRDKAYKPLLLKELINILEVPEKDEDLLKQVLDELISEGKIIKTKKRRFALPEKMNLVLGKLRVSDRGFGFLIPHDETLKDIFIQGDNMNGAMDKDIVMVKIVREGGGDKKSEGEVTKVMERANSYIVGTFEKSKNFAFVVPDNRRITGDIFVAKNNYHGAKDGQKVVVEITAWPEARRNAEGKIIEIIGDKGESGTDIKAIMRAYHLKEEFPQKVLEEAESISDKVLFKKNSKRKDLRNILMVTIDGEDAKDLDDAVSIEKKTDGYRLGVHIADVAHYVKENSYLDEEAQKRGTSVYLVDRVIPMLPQKLSNGICSLNPNVDRFAMSVFMDLDGEGKVLNYEFTESLINVNQRMTYENVYKILEEDDRKLKNKYEYLLESFYQMKELALILRKRRFQRGSIDFDFPEAKVFLSPEGKPLKLEKTKITIANQIIEEFMLLCNETVAEHFYWANSPFIYRIHEEPDSEKIENFAEFVFNLGYVLKGFTKIHPKALQQLLEKVKGKKEEKIISTVMLRSMKKARYTSVSHMHFGLCAKYYTHFTSPIRRYPDLFIHRIMKESLTGKISSKREEVLERVLPEITQSCSEREREAEEAERQTVDLKKVEYMKQFEGEVFPGIISGVTNFGIFIELENTVEGLLRLHSIVDDYYVYHDKRHVLVGERTGKTYKIGDSIDVLIARVDLKEKQIEFVLDHNS
jgi:ribonuclease R